MHLTQTDVYLEELTDVVPETDNTTQTDAFLERPPTPKFVPAKSGVDAETQIEEGRSSWCLTALLLGGPCSPAQNDDCVDVPSSIMLA